MKVAYFIGSLNRGGTETLVLDTFRKKELANYESILIYRNEGDLSEAYRATGVPMFRIKHKESKLAYIVRLRRLLKREGVGLLHTQTLTNGLVGILCTICSPVKIVASFHGLFFKRKSLFLSHILIWFSDGVIFVSQYVKDWYIRHIIFVPQNRCYVVYNGIDFSKLDKPCEQPDFLGKETPVMPGIVKMAMVGNFVSGRSQSFLCKALKQLVDSGHREFHFYFVGKRVNAEPHLYDECVEYCRENSLLYKQVFFLGGRGDVPAILQHIDAFVYSTHRDTFGIAVVEAIASGLPVVVNDWAVMREITKDGELATLYRTLDCDDCVAKLNNLILNIDERKIQAQIAAKNVRQLFSIENHIRNLFEVYSSVVS